MKKPKPIKMWAIVYEGDILLDYMARTKADCLDVFFEYHFYYLMSKEQRRHLKKTKKVQAIKVEVRAI